MSTSQITVPNAKAADGNYTFVKQDQANTVAATVGSVGWPAGSFNAEPVVPPATNDLAGALKWAAPVLTEINTGGPTTSPFPRPGVRVSIKVGAATIGEYIVAGQTPTAGQVRFTNNGIQVHATDAAAADHSTAFAALDNTNGTVTWTFVSLPA